MLENELIQSTSSWPFVEVRKLIKERKDLIAKKKFNRLVAWQDRKVVDVSIEEGINDYRKVNTEDILLKTAISLGIYIGN